MPSLGLALFGGGVLAMPGALLMARVLFPIVHPRKGVCAGCGYDLTGLPGDAPCPECGVRQPKSAQRNPFFGLTIWLVCCGLIISSAAAAALLGIARTYGGNSVNSHAQNIVFAYVEMLFCMLLLGAITLPVWRSARALVIVPMFLFGCLTFAGAAVYGVLDDFLWNPSSVTGISLILAFFGFPYAGYGMILGVLIAMLAFPKQVRLRPS